MPGKAIVLKYNRKQKHGVVYRRALRKTIVLKYDRKSFEEIYLGDNHFKTFFNKKAKRYATLFLIFLILFCFSFSGFWHSAANAYFGFASFSAIFMLIALFKLFLVIYPKISTVRQVKPFLDNVEKISSCKVILSENAFVYIEDSKEVIEKISEIKKAQIEDKYIFINTNSQQYLIPAKSVSEGEYLYIKRWLTEKMK